MGASARSTSNTQSRRCQIGAYLIQVERRRPPICGRLEYVVDQQDYAEWALSNALLLWRFVGMACLGRFLSRGATMCHVCRHVYGLFRLDSAIRVHDLIAIHAESLGCVLATEGLSDQR